MKAEISIVIPIYNVEKTLRRCIDSAVNQTYRDIEIILVDDGATDNSGRICDEYAERDARIRVIHKRNGGVCDARNAGTQAVTTTWLTFAESDDYLTPDACETMLREAEKHRADLVMGAYYKKGANGERIKHLFFEDHIVFTQTTIHDVLLKKVLGLTGKELKLPEQIDSLLTCSAKLFRTDIIKENHIEWIDRKVIYSDCLDYILKYVYRCRSAVYIDKPLYYYVRTNTESQTASYRPFTIELWQYQFAELEKFITRHNLEKVLDEAYYNRICFSVIPIGGNAYRMHDFFRGFAEISRIFRIPIYKKAFDRFSLRYLPVHWKMFFFTAKYRLRLSFYLSSIAMRKIMNKSRNL